MRRTALVALFCFVAGCSGGSDAEEGGELDSGAPDGSSADAEDAGDTGSVDASDADDASDASDTGDAFVACKADDDCASSTDGKACDLATGKCVPCTLSSDLCAASEHCDALTLTCVTGCKTDEGCSAAAGDAGTDADAATTTKSRCEVASHTCVECTKDDHCAEGFLCLGNVCSVGCSDTKACPSGQACCAGGCVDLATNVDHCGACETKCSIPGGSGKCEASACAVGSCSGTHADCDKNPATGCEVDVATDAANCGACGKTCALPHTTGPTCATGTCGYTACEAGWADCDGDKSNGCEKHVDTDPSNCGGCGVTCSVTNGVAACVDGGCAVGTCTGTFRDCDKSAGTGCEVDSSTDVANCGSCGAGCPAVANGTQACIASACAVGSCNADFADCNGVLADGCEVNVKVDANNCGGCGTVCAVAHGTPGCAGGACAIDGCSGGWDDCDGSVATGCETHLVDSVDHCGACFNKCTAANGSAACESSACKVASCTAPFADCNGKYVDGCEINTANDPSNCGACGNACSAPHASTYACTLGACAVTTCSGTFKDCNGSFSDGCESDITADAKNCGACGSPCAAGGSCVASSCVYPTSCQALRISSPSAASGTYRIDPDGAGPIAPFDVYCEMTGALGWTLALKLDGSKSTFAYDNAIWTNTTLLNASSTDLTLVEAKFASYNTLPFTELRLEMVEGGIRRVLHVNALGTSLQNRIAAGAFVATGASPAAWRSLLSAPTLQPNCNREGLDNAVGSYARVRIGILGNNENDCASPDSYIGFGGGPVACLGGATPITTGNVGACGSIGGDKSVATFGYVFVR